MILAESQQDFASPGEALAHYGVKGMKWGVRKQEETGSQDRSTKDSSGKVGPKPVKTSPEPAAAKSIPPLPPRKQKAVDRYLKNAELMGTRVSELKVANEALDTKTWRDRSKKSFNDDTIKELERQKKQAEREAERVKNGKLTRKQKQVIAGAVVVTALVGYSVYARGQQSGALNSWQLLAKARLQGRDIPFNTNKALSQKMSAEDLLAKVARPVNPNYKLPGGQMNCRRSTYTYELRRRGFDVHATTSSVGWGQSESGVINALTTKGKDYFRATSMSNTVVNTGFSDVARGDKRTAPGAKILLDKLHNSDKEDLVGNIISRIKAGKPLVDEDEGAFATMSSSKKVLAELAKQPEGARGEVLFKFPGFGHSMAYEIVDGAPKIFDSQKGTMYDAVKKVESKWDGFTAAEIRRLDNLDLDLNFLTRWSTNI